MTSSIIMNNITDEIKSRLSSKIKTRSLLAGVTVEELERILSKMNEILAEKQAERQRQEENRLAKKESIDEIKKIIEERGLSLEDFDLLDQHSRPRRTTQKFVFAFENSAGEIENWTGSTVGRLPTAFQSYLERTGKKRNECVVEKLND